MILTRAPLRVSFAGGGSDLPAFYRRRPGAVTSATIDRYVYTLVEPSAAGMFRAATPGWSGQAGSIREIPHALIRECLTLVEPGTGLCILSVADVPTGTGLGSSSAFTVSLLHALYRLRGEDPGPEELASAACTVEIERARFPIGKQDQYATAFGGLNHLRFDPSGRVSVAPVDCTDGVRRALEDRLLLFFVGGQRWSGAILRTQGESMRDPQRLQMVEQMVDLAGRFQAALSVGRLDRLGEILQHGWDHKRRLHPEISNRAVEDACRRARDSGAQGMKLLGAGGRGFLLVFAEPERHPAIRRALSAMPELPVRFEDRGSTVLMAVPSQDSQPTTRRSG